MEEQEETQLDDETKFARIQTALHTTMDFATAFAECVSASDCDFIANILLTIHLKNKTSVALVKHVIYYELHKNQTTPQNIFRSNSLASKLLGSYVKQVGREFLKFCLGDVLNQLLSDKSLSLEIDGSKMRDGKDNEKVIEKNRILLKEWCDKILTRVMDPEVLKQLPFEVQTIAAYIAEISDALQLDTPVLIGSYIMLRFLNPAIATPDVFDIVSAKKKTPNGQRNLILISKILQNLANNVKFGNKEKFMVCMNDFLNDKTPKMREFLLSILKLEQCNTSNNNSTTTTTTITIEETDMQLLHSKFYELSKSMVAFFIKSGIEKVEPIQVFMSKALLVIQLITQLGFPTQPHTTSLLSIEECKDALCEQMSQTITQLRKSVDNSLYDRDFFFYEGKVNIQLQPVFYLIMNRFSFDYHSQNIPQLVYHFYRTMGDKLNRPFQMVLDMSYCGVFKRELSITFVENLCNYLSSNHHKNLNEILVLHSSHHFLNVEKIIKEFMRCFKSRRKISKEITEWKQLMEYILPSNIMLPEESKMFIPILYKMDKVNAKGKHQDRFVKITPRSILNIDPKNNSIRNERLLSEMEEISAPPMNLEIQIKFSMEEQEMEDLSEPEEVVDSLTVRRYICTSVEERQVLLEDLFETTIRTQEISTMLSFVVLESTSKTKPRERLYRITNDSIMTIDKRVIKSEIPFLGIEHVKWEEEKKIILLKLKNEELDYEIQLMNKGIVPDDFIRAIREGMERATRTVEKMLMLNPLTLVPFEEVVTQQEEEQVNDTVSQPVQQETTQEE